MQFYIVCFGTILDFLQIVFIEKVVKCIKKAKIAPTGPGF